MIDALVVEDSMVERELLVFLLRSDPDIRVVGTAADGEEAVDAVLRLRPSVVVMDISMPRLDGFKATRRLMETSPLPIVLVTSVWNPRDAATVFRAVEAGALTVVAKPAGIGHPDHAKTVRAFLQTVKTMAEVKVVRRWRRVAEGATGTASDDGLAVATAPGAADVVQQVALERELRRRANDAATRIEIVAIGASTGGPPALKQLLVPLPATFPVPVVVVQHISAGFVDGLCRWLDDSLELKAVVATDGALLTPGHVFLAPDGAHMEVTRGRSVALRSDPPESGLRPSVGRLFRSVAEVYRHQAVGVLMTGMGSDGSRELGLIKARGGITVAQNEATSVVFGMPGVAVAERSANYVLPPESIGQALRASAAEPRALPTGADMTQE